MHKFKKLINKHKEIFSFAFFFITTLTILTITLILVRTNQDVRSRAASAPCTLSNPILIDSVEQEFIEILNNHRATLNAGPLRLSENLSRAAQWQAEDMIENNYFNHVDSLGRSYQQRSLDCGASAVTGSENLANGAVSAQAAFNAWQASTQGHKENMENAIWSQTGIARVVANGQVRWVQTFSVGNDGTTPELEDPNIPTATPTEAQNPTATPTGSKNPTPTTQPITPTIPPAEGTVPIKFSFKLPGIGSNAALGKNLPFRPTRSIPVVFLDDGGFATISEARYNTDTSLFEGIANIDEQKLTSSNTLKFILKSAIEQLVPVSSITDNTVPQFKFTMGDINSSNSVDLNDYIDMIACIKKIRCTPDEISIDLNDDTLVDILDLNILLRSIDASF